MRPLAAALVGFSLFTPSLRANPGATVGSLIFPNSGSTAAQKDFLHGLAQLHNFEYEDAAEAFRRAQQTDPAFAMAYWGEAMTKNHPIWMEQDLDAARGILKRLAPTPEGRLAKAPTSREKAYVASLDLLYGEGDKLARDRAYSGAMGALSEEFPDDPDASAFFALSLLGTAHEGRDIPIYMKAAGILEPLFCRYPEHPGIAHYLIHACDDPVHAPLALPAARAYSKIAPDAGHAQHMCSHIFLALGLWDDVVSANETAIGVVNRNRSAKGLPEVGCGHYPLWLEYGYLQQGRIRDADRILAGCRNQFVRAAGEAHVHPGSHLDPDNSAAGSYTEMRAFRVFEAGEPGAGEPPTAVDLANFPGAKVTDAFTRGLTLARRGESKKAREASAAFDEARAEVEKKLPNEVGKMNTGRMKILRLELDAAIELAEGRGESAEALLRQAAALENALPSAFGPPFVEKPSDEMLGEALLALKRPAEAAKAFAAALGRAPRRTLSLLGLARAQAQAGEAEMSRRTYGELKQILRRADRVPEDVKIVPK
jgi:tetratricopeptide (TPR) repeat protein